MTDPVPVSDLLKAGLEASPDAKAVVSREQGWTFQELDDASNRLAASYQQLGLEPGDRVASLMPNRCVLLVHYLACMKAGFVTVPLNYRYTPDEISHALQVSGAEAMVHHAERTGDIEGCDETKDLIGRIVTFGTKEGTGGLRLEELVTGPAMEYRAPVIDPDSPACIFFTSGSTGPAKGVTHSFESIAHVFRNGVNCLEMTREDILLPASSLSHIGAYYISLSALSVGARVLDWRIGSDVFGNEVGVFSGPVACAFDSDDRRVVEESVEEGRRDDGVSEDVAPFREASVRSGDHRAFFVSGVYDLEEQARSALRDGQISDFIDDEDRGPREEADFFGELALAFGFGEAVGEFCERRLVDALSGFDGGDAECRGEMGFSCARRSEEVDGFASPDEVELGQGGDSLAVEGWLECEVEAFDGFDGEEFRGSQCDVDSPGFAQGAIFAEEGVDGFDGCDLALLQPPQRGSERFKRPGHFQADQGGADAVDQFGHRVAPCCSRRRPTAS